MPEGLRRRRRARHVDEDLVEHLLVALSTLGIGHLIVLEHGLSVLAPLALERRLAPRAVRWQVAEQQLPRHRAALVRYARPARGAQCLEVDDLGSKERLKLTEALHFQRHRR